MMVGKILLLSLSQPGAPGERRDFTQQELYDELLTLADESVLLKLVNNRSTGSDLDRQKLQEKCGPRLTAYAVWGWCGLWATIAASFALPNRYSALAPMCAPATTRAKRSAV